jgi:hypothetical protein
MMINSLTCADRSSTPDNHRSVLMPGVDADGVEVEFVGADAVGGPGGQA